jgi:hypothetical protein
MGTQVNINGITGQSPFNIYVCLTEGTQCIFIDKIENTPYDFIIPPPYDTLSSYMLKIIDGNNSVITGQTTVTGL